MPAYATSECPTTICAQPCIQLREQNGVIHLTFSRGILELQDLERIETQFEDVLRGVNSAGVLLDLTGLDYMPSTTLGILVALHKRLLARGGHLHVVSSSPFFDRMFRTTKLDHLLKIFGSVEEALAGFASA